MSHPSEESLLFLEEIGGESLLGSGFENEVSDTNSASPAYNPTTSHQLATPAGGEYGQ